jgi:hypothetical protein
MFWPKQNLKICPRFPCLTKGILTRLELTCDAVVALAVLHNFAILWSEPSSDNKESRDEESSDEESGDEESADEEYPDPPVMSKRDTFNAGAAVRRAIVDRMAM